MIRRLLAYLFLISISVSGCLLADDWTTPSEKSGYRSTPSYEETMEYIRRIAAVAPGHVKLEAFGKTGQGRTLWTVIVSRDGMFDPEAIHKADHPVVLIQNGIHAGEIDGKDASLALLRDMVITGTQSHLLEHAVIVIIPVYNVDGHERISRFNRMNQNGPEKMGWRTTATNLNLNRDYLKADTVETRAFLKLWNRWLPDFYFDNHVTDGADYQYDITYVLDSSPDVDPGLGAWVKALAPEVEKAVRDTGHKISPYIWFLDGLNPMSGLKSGQNPPRYSTGYSILQNRPGMLVEMHMLKDYKTRVTGNYELLRTTIEFINRDAQKLVRLNRAADAATMEAGQAGGDVALTLTPSGEAKPFEFEGIRFRITDSDVSGAKKIEYMGEPITLTIPGRAPLKVSRAVKMPAAYIIPAQWVSIIDVLEVHGLELKRTARAFTADVELYRCPTPTWRAAPFEGRHTASFDGSPMGDAGFASVGIRKQMCVAENHQVEFPAESVVVPMAQRAAKVAVHFLEPEAPDSAVAWGFMDAIFEQKEYGESYVLEKAAREMMAAEPELKREFEQKLASDPEFAASPAARLDFFYHRSPYSDNRIGLYPIGRLNSLDNIPFQ